MTALDRLREIRALVAEDPMRALYSGVDDRTEVDAEVWKRIASAQEATGLYRGWLTQDERLAVLDTAIAALVREEIRAVNDEDAAKG